MVTAPAPDAPKKRSIAPPRFAWLPDSVLRAMLTFASLTRMPPPPPPPRLSFRVLSTRLRVTPEPLASMAPPSLVDVRRRMVRWSSVTVCGPAGAEAWMPPPPPAVDDVPWPSMFRPRSVVVAAPALLLERTRPDVPGLTTIVTVPSPSIVIGPWLTIPPALMSLLMLTVEIPALKVIESWLAGSAFAALTAWRRLQGGAPLASQAPTPLAVSADVETTNRAPDAGWARAQNTASRTA